ncbi:MAG: MlaD family protein [Pyrinomonadaceae bacterium]
MVRNKKTVGLREVRVGLVVVVSIAALIFLLLNASGDISLFARKLTLRARFASADGVRPGAEVRLAGVRVGEVENVSLLQPSDDPNAMKIEVQLKIDDQIDGRPAQERIRKNSQAQLGSPSLLGSDKLVNITPGTSLADPIQENDLLITATGTGDFAELTASSNDFVTQLNKISDQVDEIVRKINEGEGSIGRFLNDEAFYNNLNATLRDVQGVTSQVRSGQGSAGKFINDPALYDSLNTTVGQLQSIAEDLRRGRGTAGKLFTDERLYEETRATISSLSRSAEDINTIIVDIRAGRGTLGKLLADETIYNDARSAIARFNTTAERVDGVVAAAQRGEGTLGKLITDDQLYSNVNQLSSESVKLLYDFRQNPKKYLTVKFELF